MAGPDQPKADMVMQFVRKNGGGAVYAECALDKDPKDEFMNGFTPQTYDTYSDFFEITKFAFGIEVKDEDAAKKNPAANQHKHPSHDKGGKDNPKTKGAFMSWRAATDSDIKNIQYPLEPDKFSFDRLIDSASIDFFEACCTSQTFEKAILVKRVSTDATKPQQGFLKMVFYQVMITGLNWDDGEMLNETCEFVCRGFEVFYKRQKADGSLSEMVSASWDSTGDALPKRNGKK
jgi:type VI protein secretion system component Hcp